MLFNILLLIQAIVASVMIVLILMQKSEGGGLGVGGSPSGMLSARSAADFMTRSTTICAILFVALSIALAGVATTQGTGTIDATDAAKAAAAKAAAPAAPPANAIPLDGAGAAAQKAEDNAKAREDAAAARAALGANEGDEGVPLSQ